MNKNTILIGGLILMGGIAAWYFFSSGAPTPVTPGGIPGISVLTKQEQEKIKQYRTVLGVKFDFGLLTDPVFLSLEDVPLPPPPSEPLGRENPFLTFPGQKEAIQATRGKGKAAPADEQEPIVGE